MAVFSTWGLGRWHSLSAVRNWPVYLCIGRPHGPKRPGRPVICMGQAFRYHKYQACWYMHMSHVHAHVHVHVHVHVHENVHVHVHVHVHAHVHICWVSSGVDAIDPEVPLSTATCPYGRLVLHYLLQGSTSWQA